MTALFVYGTLKRGQRNHRAIERSRFFGEARTAPQFTLHDLLWYPAMVLGGTTSVAGELYDVDDATLAVVDRIEGHPTYYKRIGIPLLGGDIVAGYVFRLSVDGAPRVEDGCWMLR
jgi:gamma-glutamylcyclotransferase (GGCT)/AIG2-like uncharacterized protein YtfP